MQTYYVVGVDTGDRKSLKELLVLQPLGAGNYDIVSRSEVIEELVDQFCSNWRQNNPQATVFSAMFEYTPPKSEDGNIVINEAVTPASVGKLVNFPRGNKPKFLNEVVQKSEKYLRSDILN